MDPSNYYSDPNSDMPIIGKKDRNQALAESNLEMRNWLNQTENIRTWNEYNEQIQKKLEAGLNPLFSDSAPQSSVSASAPSGGTDFPFGDITSSLGSIFEAVMALPTLKKTQAETKNINAQTGKTNAETDILIQTTPSTIREGLAKARYYDSLDKMNEKQTELFHQQLSINEEAIKQLIRENDIKYQQMLIARGNLSLGWHNFAWNKQYQQKQLGIQQFEATTNRYNTKANFMNIYSLVNQRVQDMEMQGLEYERQLKKDGLDWLTKAPSIIKEDYAFKVGPLTIGHKSVEGSKGAAKILSVQHALFNILNSNKLSSKQRINAVNMINELDAFKDEMGLPDLPMPSFNGAVGSNQQLMFGPSSGGLR